MALDRYIDLGSTLRGRSELVIPAAAGTPGVGVDGLNGHMAFASIPSVLFPLPDTPGDRAAFCHVCPARALVVHSEMLLIDVRPDLSPSGSKVGQGGQHGPGGQSRLDLKMNLHNK